MRIGSAGFLVGGTAGIIRGAPPFLFAAASAFQTFALGTAFWGCRTALLHSWTPAHQTPSDLAKASAVSGGVTGGLVGLITRGRSNALPGAVMMSLFGFLGQTAYNKYTARGDADRAAPGFWRRMSEKKFSPVTVLSNEEYAEILREKMIKVEAEIAIVDDRIAALREQQRSQHQDDAPNVPSNVPR